MGQEDPRKSDDTMVARKNHSNTRPFAKAMINKKIHQEPARQLVTAAFQQKKTVDKESAVGVRSATKLQESHALGCLLKLTSRP